MNTDTILNITLIAVGLAEILLAYRIWRLERRLLAVMEHFIAAKNFLGGIEKHVKDYKGVADGIMKNGLNLKLKSERFGALEIDLKRQEEEHHEHT